MRLGLITVNYNNTKDTNQLVTDFLSQEKDNAFLYIADLSDREPFKLKDQEKIFVQTLPNKGYSFGVNQGIRFFLRQGIDLFCVLNNDVFLGKNFIEKVLKGFKRFSVFGGKIYYAPGYEYHKDRYKKKELGKVIWYAGGIIDWKNILAKHRGVDEVDFGQYDLPEETDFITGCLFCFNKRVVEKVGFWDKGYFLYYEDVDYSVRVKKAGFYLIYNPEVILYHKNAQSTGGSGSQIHLRFQRRSRLRFALKYASLRTRFHIVKNYLLNK